jgi:hypothetical protein
MVPAISGRFWLPFLSDEFAKMAKRVAYTIHPVNGVAEYQWNMI